MAEAIARAAGRSAAHACRRQRTQTWSPPLQRECKLSQRLSAASPRLPQRSLHATSFRCATEAPAQPTSTPTSSASSESSNGSRKIQAIVDQIATLTLLEAADLVQALKTRLNITEVAFAAPAAAAPTQAAPSAATDAASEAPPAEKPKEKTLFNVNLTKIDAAQKAKAIKEVKAVMPTMNLVEAKKFVESLPKVLKENATKDEAEKLKKALEAIGAEVTLD